MYIVLVGFIIGLTLALLNITQTMLNRDSPYVGYNQEILVKTYQRVQEHLLFIDVAAKVSSERTILKLAEDMGFEEESGCGSYLGYNILNNRTGFCFPEDLSKGFTSHFNQEFDHYIEFYKKAYLPKENYGISLIQGVNTLDILGIANQDLKIQIVAEESMPQFCPTPEGLTEIKGITCSTTYSKCELNKEALERLELAREIAAEKGYDLLITSATRTFQDQLFLFNKYGSGRAARPTCNAPHISGKAVDIILIKNNKPAAGMSSGEGKMDDMTIGDRRDLQEIMCSAGFQRYMGEFWHYEYKTGRWKDPQENGCILS